MSRNLPDGWTQVRLSDILLTIEAGKSFTCEPRQAAPDEWGIIKVSAMTWGSFDEHENKAVPPGRKIDSRHEIHPGDILVSRANTEAYVGAPVLVGQCRPQLLLSDKSLRLVPARGIDRQWLVHALSSPTVRGQISAKSTGAQESMRNISQRALGDIEIGLPPLAEQRRIVDALDDHLSRLDAGERIVKTTIQRLAHLRDSIVTPTNRAKVASDEMAAPRPQSAGVVDGDLPMLPASWRWMRLGDIADVVGGITKDVKRQADPDFVEVPYLRVANVQRGRIDLTTVTKIRVPRSKASQLALQHGDVLLNEGGDRDKLGRGWIWEDQIEHVIHQNHVFRARIIDKVLDPKLLAWHANGFGRAWFEANGKQSVNLASISLKKIRLFPVPVPPADEQARMVEEIEEQLSVLDNATAAAGQALKKAAGLRRSLLTEAFSGRLVPQDQTDEPASELLARIEAERASPEIGKAKPARLARTTATRARPPKKTTTVPTGIQEELSL